MAVRHRIANVDILDACCFPESGLEGLEPARAPAVNAARLWLSRSPCVPLGESPQDGCGIFDIPLSCR